MTGTDTPRFGILLATLAEVYQRPLSDVATEAYFVALADCAIDELEVAATRILRHRTDAFMPVPGEWRQVALEMRRERRLRVPALEAGRPEISETERLAIATEMRALVERLSAGRTALRPAPAPPAEPAA